VTEKPNKKYVNPYRLFEQDLPLIVLSTHSSGFTQWLIRWRIKSNWHHIMMMITPGMFASQGNVFSSASIDRYTTKFGRLKFWRIKDLTEDQKKLLSKMIKKDLTESWWKRKYDYIGILGQALGIKKINNPWSMYCSERVAKYLKKFLDGIPDHPNPGDLNEIFKNHPQMEVVGYWWAD